MSHEYFLTTSSGDARRYVPRAVLKTNPTSPRRNLGLGQFLLRFVLLLSFFGGELAGRFVFLCVCVCVFFEGGEGGSCGNHRNRGPGWAGDAQCQWFTCAPSIRCYASLRYIPILLSRRRESCRDASARFLNSKSASVWRPLQTQRTGLKETFWPFLSQNLPAREVRCFPFC